jgi:beta-phosphoglucomutase-like phosphatase (HAD superfamily)
MWFFVIILAKYNKINIITLSGVVMSLSKPLSVPLIKAVLFDCDGVLVDSESIIIGVWHQLAIHAGSNIEYDDLFRQMTGQTMDTCIDQVAHAIGKDVDQAMRDQAWNNIGDAFKTDLVAFEGVSDVLSRLKASSMAFAVASNSETDPLYFKLDKTELRAYFENQDKTGVNAISEFVFSSEMVKNGKPAPDVYLLAAEKLGVEAKECLVIEDSVLGAQAGIAAGMTVWGVVYPASGHRSESLAAAKRLTDAGCTRVLSSITQVLDVL